MSTNYASVKSTGNPFIKIGESPDRFAGLRQSRELEDKFLLYVRILMASGLTRPAAKTRALDFLGL